MNTKNPRKKLDFFNGGKGVDLSLYEEEEEEDYDDDQCVDVEDNPEIMEERSPSAGANMYSPPPSEQMQHMVSWPQSQKDQAIYTPSPPPYSPQPPHFAHAPVPHYLPPSFGNAFETPDHTLSHLNMGISPHMQPQNIPLHPYSHPPPLPIPNAMQGNPFPVATTLFPEPTYSGFMGTAGFSPLRPMDTNGMNMGFVDPLNGINLPSGMNNGRDTESGRKKRQQKCSLCSNHGITVDVKGHKWFCPFRNCDCERCTITRGRQHHMKEQQKLTRHLQRLQ